MWSAKQPPGCLLMMTAAQLVVSSAHWELIRRDWAISGANPGGRTQAINGQYTDSNCASTRLEPLGKWLPGCWMIRSLSDMPSTDLLVGGSFAASGTSLVCNATCTREYGSKCIEVYDMGAVVLSTAANLQFFAHGERVGGINS